MTAAEIFRDRRVGMIAGATVLHLTALAVAWALVPPGTETRLNRPMEASLSPAPSSDAVNENSSPLQQQVDSANVTTEAALEDMAEVVPPDAVKTEMTTPEIPQIVRPDAVAAQTARPIEQKDVSPEKVRPDSASDEAVAMAMPETSVAAALPTASAALAPPQQVAALAPDVLTSQNTDESVAAPIVPPQVMPAQDGPPSPAVEKPKSFKVEKPKQVTAPKKKAEPPAKVQPPVKSPPAKDMPRLASLDTKTTFKRAQRGGAGAISDVGTVDNANSSGATAKRYNALLNAAIKSRVLAQGSIDCKSGSKSDVGFTVSVQGRISGVRLVGASSDSALNAAALAAVRSASPPPPFNGALVRSISIACPRRS